MRESPNGMASAFEGLSRFARERVSVRRPAEGAWNGVSADSRLSLQAKRTGTAPVLFAYAEGARNGVSADICLSLLKT